MKKVASFDIFDTSIIRACGTPSSFFDILSKKVFKNDVSDAIRQAFINERETAEIRASQKKEATIYEIYNCFSFNHPQLIKKDDLVSTEIALEKKLAVPVLNIKRTIKKYRTKGYKIIFISDTYLPGIVLTEILKKNELFEPGDSLYASCDIGLCKHTGDIYKYIHDTERLSYNKWKHFGDNNISDLEKPRRLGIKTVYVNNEYSLYSKIHLNNHNLQSFTYTNILAGLSRSLSLSTEKHPRKLLLLDVIAPLYCSYLYTIIQDAIQKKINKIYFCARDTYPLFIMSKKIISDMEGIQTKYLSISRESLYKSNRELLLKYFVQEGLASLDDKIAIIDIATTGKTISFINQLLSSAGYKDIHGYFLFKYDSDYIKNNNLCNCHIQYNLIKGNKEMKCLFNGIFMALIEDVFSSTDESRTVGYSLKDNYIYPVTNNRPQDEDVIQNNIKEIKKLQRTFLEKYVSLYSYMELQNYSQMILDKIAIPALCRFFNYPTKEYINSLISCNYFYNGKKQPYIKKENYCRLFFKRGKDTIWPKATIIYNLPNWLTSYLTANNQHKLSQR